MKKEITIEQLKKLGFKKEKIEYTNDYNILKETTIYVLKRNVNSCIYFNPKEKIYKFYYKTLLGETSNYVHLDINNIEDIMIIIRIFQFKK